MGMINDNKGKGKNRANKIDTAFALMVFCVFAVSVFLVLILSASAYVNTADIANDGRNERIALSYVRTKIRATDTAGAVHLGDFGGVQALHLTERFDDREFVTLIYYYNGWVRELFHEIGFEFEPADGIPLFQIDAPGLMFEWLDGGLLRVSTAHDTMLIFPRSAEDFGGAADMMWEVWD